MQVSRRDNTGVRLAKMKNTDNFTPTGLKLEYYTSIKNKNSKKQKDLSMELVNFSHSKSKKQFSEVR